MSIFIIMSCFYSTEIWFMYLASLFFVPQIVHNAVRGQKVKFDALYVFFFGFLRMILPVIHSLGENASNKYILVIRKRIFLFYFQVNSRLFFHRLLSLSFAVPGDCNLSSVKIRIKILCPSIFLAS